MGSDRLTQLGDASQSDSMRRAARIRKVVEECMRRRGLGEAFSNADIAALHPDLSPELGQELAVLALIERARETARADSGSSAFWPADRVADAARLPGAFPGYDIVGEIHRGGQGVVYQATQKATRRKVAIKVMHGGPFAGTRDRIRFEREAYVLGQMNHANIVTVHDGGTVAGNDFFVMDYVEGEPLDAYVQKVEKTKSRKIEIGELLRLFVKIGDAVNAAHLRGVIHRDLKPSNILVDPAGVPRVLDFGLAKFTATGPNDVGPTMTVTGQFVGSLPWCSPEQAAGEAVDTRTDVYALGVVLYQCLTGRFPYPVVGRLADVLSHVKSTEPIRPRTLRGDINDEVETIVLKCLSKDRERRYQTAGELTRDITHYLSGQPIEAKRDSGLYVLRKHLRRHRGAVGVAAGFVILLAFSSVALTVLYRRAETQAAAAEEKRRSAELVADFMSQTLEGAGPAVAIGRDATMLREMMDAAAKRIHAGELAEAPDAELRLRLAIGETYRKVAAYDAAAGMLEPTLALARTIHGEPHADIAESLSALGRLMQNRGQTTAALETMQEALEMHAHLSQGDQPALATALNDVATCLEALGRAAEALPKYEAALEMRQRLSVGDHPRIAAGLSNLASCLESLGRSAEALPKYEASLEMKQRLFGGDHPDVAQGLNNVAYCLRSLGRSAEALPKYEAALEMYRRLFKSDHPDVSAVLGNIAACLLAQDRSEEALSKFEEALEMDRRLFPGDHPEVAKDLNNIGACLRSLGRPSEALPRLEAALEMRKRLLSADHPDLAMTLSNVAFCLQSLNRSAEALPKYEAALEMWQRTFDGDHPDIARGLNNVAQCLRSLGRLAEALPRFEAALEMNQRLFTGDHPYVAICLFNVAACQRLLGRPDEALGKYEEALAMRKRILPNGHMDIAVSEAGLGSVLVDLDRLDEAEPLLRDSYAALAAKSNAPVSHRETILKALVKLYESRHAAHPDQGFDAIAADWREKLEQLMSSKPPESSPVTQPAPPLP